MHGMCQCSFQFWLWSVIFAYCQVSDFHTLSSVTIQIRCSQSLNTRQWQEFRLDVFIFVKVLFKIVSNSIIFHARGRIWMNTTLVANNLGCTKTKSNFTICSEFSGGTNLIELQRNWLTIDELEWKKWRNRLWHFRIPAFLRWKWSFKNRRKKHEFEQKRLENEGENLC